MFKNVASQKLTVLAFADAGHASLDAGERDRVAAVDVGRDGSGHRPSR